MPKSLASASSLALLLFAFAFASACRNEGPQPGASGGTAGAQPAGAASGTARPVAAAPGEPLVADISVTEKGFEPARIEVRASQPVVLKFTRKVEATCADAVDVQGDPVRHMLPLGRTVEVKVTPPASGEVAFACPMKMLHGAVVVLPR
jgi:Cupredoxin-like domain